MVSFRFLKEGIGIINRKWGPFWVDIQPEASFHPMMERENCVLCVWLNSDIVLESLLQTLESIHNVILCDLEASREVVHEQVSCNVPCFQLVWHSTGLDAHQKSRDIEVALA